jgi:hypothetical protein
MSVDETTPPKKAIAENNVVEAKPDSASNNENKPDLPSNAERKPDAPASKQGMGEGQKPGSKAYKENWNDIFGKRKSDSASSAA